MPDVIHSTLGSSESHEPKGIETANSGEVYVADGAGSGVMTPLNEFAEIHSFETDSVTISTIGTTAQTFPFSSNGSSVTLTADSANNRITVPASGTYFVTFCASISTVASADAGVYEFKVLDDGVSTNVAASKYLSGTNDSGSLGMSGVITVAAGSQITVSVESDNGGNTDDIDVYYSSLTVLKVA